MSYDQNYLVCKVDLRFTFIFIDCCVSTSFDLPKS